MLRTRGKFLLPVLILITILVLSGCQELLQQIPLLQSTKVPQATATVTSIAPEPSVTMPPAVVESQPAEITIWIPPQFDPTNGSTAGTLLKKQLEKFTQEFPQITVNIRLKAVEGAGGLLDSLSTASAAAPDAAPGLILLPRRDFEVAADAGLLVPIETSDSQLNETDYFPFALDLARVKDIRYGLPFSGDMLVFAYNSLQIGFPPLLWSGIYQQKTIVAIPGGDPEGLLTSLFYLNNSGTFTEKEGKVELQESALQKALQGIHDGAEGQAFPYWTADYTTFEQSYQALQDSKATYAIIWASQQLSDPGGKNTISTIPSDKEDSFTIADGWVLAFPQASSKQLPESMTLAKYLIEPGFQQKWSEAAGVVPVNRSALSKWNNSKVSVILLEIAESARVIPGNKIFELVGPLFSQATQDLIRQQVGTIEAANRIIEALKK